MDQQPVLGRTRCIGVPAQARRAGPVWGEDEAGPVLAYGLTASVIYGIILWIISLF